MAIFPSWLYRTWLFPSVKISATYLAPDKQGMLILTDITREVAVCKEIFKAWQEQLDKQLTTKKRDLGANLRDIRNSVTILSDRYNALSTASTDLADDGVKLADEMVQLTDYILTAKGNENELRYRLNEAVHKSTALSQRATTLQNKFTMLNESLEGLRQCLERTRRDVEKKKHKQDWWQNVLDFTVTLLTALAVAMGVVGAIIAAVATGPVGIGIGAGLVTAAIATGTLTESLNQLRALLTDGKSTEDRRLAQVIDVISNMESDMETITEHVAGLEKFYSEQGDKLSSLAIQDRRIQFSRGRLETEKLKASKQEWQDVKGCFEAYHGQANSWKHDSDHYTLRSKASVQTR